MDKPNGKHLGPIPSEIPAAIIAAGMPEQPLTLRREPEAVLAEAKRAADALIAQITKKGDELVINGEIYPEFEDWQLLGRFFNVSAAVIPGTVKPIEFGHVIGFEAAAEALLTVDGRTIRVSAADAMCLNDEWMWQDKPLYQLRSMAQTRACARALRNALGWVVVLAGYKPTPREEMENERDQPQIEAPRRRSQPQPPAPARRAEPIREEVRREDPRDRDRRPARGDRPRGERYQQRFDHYHRDHNRGRDRHSAPPPQRSAGRISHRQLNRLFAIAREEGVSNGEVRRIVQHYGFEDAAEITWDVYNDIVDRVFKTGEGR